MKLEDQYATQKIENETTEQLFKQNSFKVHESEIPEYLTIRLGMTERALFARMLSKWGIPIEHVGDTFEHILNEGVQRYYKERYPDEV